MAKSRFQLARRNGYWWLTENGVLVPNIDGYKSKDIASGLLRLMRDHERREKQQIAVAP